MAQEWVAPRRLAARERAVVGSERVRVLVRVRAALVEEEREEKAQRRARALAWEAVAQGQGRRRVLAMGALEEEALGVAAQVLEEEVLALAWVQELAVGALEGA